MTPVCAPACATSTASAQEATRSSAVSARLVRAIGTLPPRAIPADCESPR